MSNANHTRKSKSGPESCKTPINYRYRVIHVSYGVGNIQALVAEASAFPKNCFRFDSIVASSLFFCNAPFSVMASLLSLRTDNRANSSCASRGNVWVLNNLSLVVANLGLGDRAYRIVALALSGRVVGRQNRSNRANNGADLVVHLFRLGLVDDGV